MPERDTMTFLWKFIILTLKCKCTLSFLDSGYVYDTQFNTVTLPLITLKLRVSWFKWKYGDTKMCISSYDASHLLDVNDQPLEVFLRNRSKHKLQRVPSEKLWSWRLSRRSLARYCRRWSPPGPWPPWPTARPPPSSRRASPPPGWSSTRPGSGLTKPLSGSFLQAWPEQLSASSSDSESELCLAGKQKSIKTCFGNVWH